MRVTTYLKQLDQHYRMPIVSHSTDTNTSYTLLRHKIYGMIRNTRSLIKSTSFIKNCMITLIGAMIGHIIGGIECAIVLVLLTSLFDDLYESFQMSLIGDQDVDLQAKLFHLLPFLKQKLLNKQSNSGFYTDESIYNQTQDDEDLIYEKEVTVMFADIRNFSALSEQMKSVDSFRFLKKYMNVMLPIINQNRGIVNQVMGDGILSVFHDSPDQAIEAAIDMQQAITQLNQEENLSLSIGIGIATGNVVAGRLDMTADNLFITSDTVNTAKRIEEMTKQFVSNVLICNQTREDSSYIFQRHSQSLGTYHVKGKKNGVHIHALLLNQNNQLASGITNHQTDNFLQVA